MDNKIRIIGSIGPSGKELLKKAMELQSEKGISIILCEPRNEEELMMVISELEISGRIGNSFFCANEFQETPVKLLVPPPATPIIEVTAILPELKKTRKEKKQEYHYNYRKNWRKGK